MEDMRLKYCMEQDRWEAHSDGFYPIPMHCGEQFHIKVGDEYLPCRLELGKDWYIVFSDTRFFLDQKTSYPIYLF
mgnify:CR=1 FL=1